MLIAIQSEISPDRHLEICVATGNNAGGDVMWRHTVFNLLFSQLYIETSVLQRRRDKTASDKLMNPVGLITVFVLYSESPIQFIQGSRKFYYNVIIFNY